MFHAITLLPGQPCTKVNVSTGLKMKCLLNWNKTPFNSIDDPEEKKNDLNVTIKRPLLEKEYKLKVIFLLQFLVSHFNNNNNNKSRNLQVLYLNRYNNENLKNMNIVFISENFREIHPLNKNFT